MEISENEIKMTAMQSQGPGGQNVNKVATAIHLCFDIKNSSLPDFYKHRLLQKSDSRITKDGVIIIKSQGTRSQETNRLTAIEKLVQLIRSVSYVPKKRRATKPTKGSKERRLKSKKVHAQRKQSRGRVDY